MDNEFYLLANQSYLKKNKEKKNYKLNELINLLNTMFPDYDILNLNKFLLLEKIKIICKETNIEKICKETIEDIIENIIENINE